MVDSAMQQLRQMPIAARREFAELPAHILTFNLNLRTQCATKRTGTIVAFASGF
jgi:hypothetical protein